MKSRFLLPLILALCAAVSAQTAPAQAPVPENAGAKKARAILDRMIQAMGGDAFLTFADMTQQGRVAAFYKGQPSGMSTPYWSFWKWPDMERVEITKQRDIVYVHNGDKGYEITYKGTRAEDPEQHTKYVRNHEHSLQVVLRRWLKQPGTLLFYDGVGVADQKQVEKVTILNSQNESVTLSIDNFSHLLVRKSYQWREPDTRFFDTEDEIYGNYHEVQGIQTPRNLMSMHNGDVNQQRFIDTTTYNTGLSDSQFQATVTYDPTQKKRK
jgi:hypothetical protein